jgi:Spy/CpxP family protein refolding chaperone
MVDESTTPASPSGKKRLSLRKKQIYQQIIVAIIILACGIVIGSGATLLRLKDRMMMPGPRPPLRDIVEDIQGRYDLTDEQVEKVEDIFSKRHETMRNLFEKIREQMDAEFKELSAEMKEILTPEQYESWENDFKSRRRGPGKFAPGGPGSGRFGHRRPGPGRRGRGRPEREEFRPPRNEPPEPNSSPD